MTIKRAVPRAAARAELRRRQNEAESFPDFLTRHWPATPGHLLALAAHLDGVRVAPLWLLAAMAPGAGKSTVFRLWVVWLLRRNPALRILYVSYSRPAANEHTRRILPGLLEAGVELERGSRSTAMLRTTAGGFVAAVGLTGGLATGLRADVVIVDDYFAGRAVAESIVSRERAWDTVTSVLVPRLEPVTGSMVFGSTRWVTDDPHGRVLASPTAARWTVIDEPAITSDGASFWPERFPLERLLELQEESPRDFASLYQCNPVDDRGAMFRGAVLTDEGPPGTAKIALGVDVGYSGKGDPTCALALAFDPASKNTWVLDVIWILGTVEEAAPMLRAFGERYASPFVWAASGMEVHAVAPTLRERRVSLITTPAIAGKAERATRVAAAWTEGRILLPRRAPWADRLVREVTGFPLARHDDAVDALASAFGSVARMGAELDGPAFASAGYRAVYGAGDSYAPTAPLGRFGRLF